LQLLIYVCSVTREFAFDHSVSIAAKCLQKCTLMPLVTHKKKRNVNCTLAKQLRNNVYPFKAQWSLYIYRQLNLHKFYVLPTQCIYVFCVDLRTNSDNFPTQH
jgi:hypothetical protein